MASSLGYALGLLVLVVLALRVYFDPGLEPRQRLPWALFTALMPVIGFAAFLLVHGYRRPVETNGAVRTSR